MSGKSRITREQMLERRVKNLQRQVAQHEDTTLRALSRQGQIEGRYRNLMVRFRTLRDVIDSGLKFHEDDRRWL